MTTIDAQVLAGQAVYTRRVLALYDFVVLGLSNRVVWKCPTPTLVAHYNKRISTNHLDVGVGSGYFLDHCHFSTAKPRIALMDLNPNSLHYCANRIKRYRPETYCRNVLEKIDFEAPLFDSIGLNYLLHCVPGTLQSKAIIFDHLKMLMKPSATLFGSTLLQGGVQRSGLAKKPMATYNKKGIFCNTQDDLESLNTELKNALIVFRLT